MPLAKQAFLLVLVLERIHILLMAGIDQTQFMNRLCSKMPKLMTALDLTKILL